MPRHDPRCAIFNDPPSLRQPSDCNCGAYGPPLANVRRTTQISPRQAVKQGGGAARASLRTSRKSPATGIPIYYETARILREKGKLVESNVAIILLGFLIEDFADWFGRDNPQFDRDKFLSACRP